MSGADLQSSRATAWLAGWLVAGRSRVTGSSLRCTRARDTVRVTRSGLVANRRSLAQAAGGVLQYQARVALGGGLVCRTGGVVYGQTTSSMDSEACEQRGVLRRCVAAQPSKCASEAARRSPEGRVTGGRPVQDRVAVGRPAQDRVTGGRPVHDRVAHGRTAGVGQGCWWTAGGDQGRPWPAGRCRSGSQVDGRQMTGSPLDGRCRSGSPLAGPFKRPYLDDGGTYGAHIPKGTYGDPWAHAIQTSGISKI